MSDPAISAAQRAWAKRYPDTINNWDTFMKTNGIAVGYTDAAREMAKSVQEIHRPVDNYGDGIMHCHTCSTEWWPCETAKRVYPSEELGL